MIAINLSVFDKDSKLLVRVRGTGFRNVSDNQNESAQFPAWIIDLVSSVKPATAMLVELGGEQQIDSAAAKLKAVVRKTDTMQVINWSAAKPKEDGRNG